MKLALYKGPATGRLPKLAHSLICWWTGSIYSHVEIVINGVCYSASNYEGRVRSKVINLDSGHWDVVEIAGDELSVSNWFARHDGQKYDWAGIARFVLPFLPSRDDQWFCSEACAEALGMSDSWGRSPQSLAVFAGVAK